MGTDLDQSKKREPGAEAVIQASPSLRLHNLLNNIPTLAEHLTGRIEAGDLLDAFLLAAGIEQVLEDSRHPDPLALNVIANKLRDRGQETPSRVGAAAARLAAALVFALVAHRRSASAVTRSRTAAADLVDRLAAMVMRTDENGIAPVPAELHEQAVSLRKMLAVLPEWILIEPIRLPSCFRNFDQCPQDLRWLADRVVERWPERERPLILVGVRTSGAYLAPLAAACLKASGFADVRWMTVRPGRRFLPREARELRAAVRAGALALVIDDPPKSWRSIGTAARQLVAAGFEPRSVALLIPALPTTPPPPPDLAGHPLVLMPWKCWGIHARLQPEAVRQALRVLLGRGVEVVEVSRLRLDEAARRGHVHALYQVRLRRRSRGTEVKLLHAKGVGIGYFGEHSLAVSDRLQAFLPTVYGVSGGILLRDWMPEAERLSADTEAVTAAAGIVRYIRERAKVLRVAEDVSFRLRRRGAAWQRAGRLLSPLFGRIAIVSRPLTEAVARVLLAVSMPSVVDGASELTNWFVDPSANDGLRKIGFDERAFCSLDVYCYDPVYDLAGAAASSGSDTFPALLRRSYEAAIGDSIEAERWLLYQLLHLDELRRDRLEQDPEAERRMSWLIQQYFCELYLNDIQPSSGGDLCAIDIDGVLESSALGFSATSPAGARTLRALLVHGHRPVLASGRSLGEIRERCASYRLEGGVAEYGAAVWITAGGRVLELLTDADRLCLDSLRACLASMPDVRLDPAYRLAVRAYRTDSTGRRRALEPKAVANALANDGCRGKVRAIGGLAQTDFIVAGITKATGLLALASELGAAGSHMPLGLAIGDTEADLEMLGLARLAFAPANASLAVRRAGIRVLAGQQQAGLEEAAARVLGHRPGNCPSCRQPVLAANSKLLLTLLSIPEKGHLRGKVQSTAILACRLAVRALSGDRGRLAGSQSRAAGPIRLGPR